MARKWIAVTGVVIIVAAVAAFTALQMSAAPSPVRLKFKIGASQSVGDIHFAAWLIAQERGIFAKYAPDVEAIDFAGGTGEVTRALADGTVDIGVGLMEGMATGIAKGADFRFVATFVETPLKWIVIVAPGSPYKSLDDLKGKTFGVSRPGSGSHITALALASERGWRDGVDFRISPLGSLTALVGGVKTGSIDAFIWTLWSPVKPLLAKGEVKSLADVDPPWPGHSVAVRREFLTKHPDAVKAILRALQEAAKVFREEEKSSIDLVVKTYKLSPEDARQWFNSVKYSADGKLPKKALEKVVDSLLAAKAIDRRIDITSLYVEGFAPIV